MVLKLSVLSRDMHERVLQLVRYTTNNKLSLRWSVTSLFQRVVLGRKHLPIFLSPRPLPIYERLLKFTSGSQPSVGPSQRAGAHRICHGV